MTIITITSFITLTGCRKESLEPNVEPEADQYFSALPLVESGTYMGYETGLGISDEHRADAPILKPIGGKIGMVIIGASNSLGEGEEIVKQIPHISGINPQLEIRVCAVPSKDVNDWLDKDNSCWARAMDSLGNLDADQVQVLWFKTDDLKDKSSIFPDSPELLEEKLIKVLKVFKEKFPNLKQVYGSGRSYTGFAFNSNSPEPSGYYTGWAWKWLVEKQTAGLIDNKLPWVSDEIYLWTDGDHLRVDGYQVLKSDFVSGEVHFTSSGYEKVAEYVLEKFSTMSTSVDWFLEDDGFF